MSKRELVAFSLFLCDFTDCEVDITGIPYYLGKWQQDFKPALSQKHYGDCVNIPMACIRCQVEYWYKKADTILASMKVKEINL